MQKLLTKRVTVNRMCAGHMRQAKKLAFYTKSANRNLSESYYYLVFAIGGWRICPAPTLLTVTLLVSSFCRRPNISWIRSVWQLISAS